jgi:hypothetical protein
MADALLVVNAGRHNGSVKKKRARMEFHEDLKALL